MINLVVIICTSIVAFPYHAEAAKTLIELDNERNVNPEIFLNRIPSRIAVDDEGTIFVTHPLDDVISVIDGDTLKVTTVPVGNYPEGIAVDIIRKLVFVANRDSNTVSVFERTQDGYRNIENVTSGGTQPVDIFLEVNGNRTFITNLDREFPISIIQESSYGGWRNVKNISLENPYEIRSIAVFDDTTYVGRENNTVSIIEDIGGEYRNVTNINVGFLPQYLTAYYPYVYAFSIADNIVSIIEERGAEYRNKANVTVQQPFDVGGYYNMYVVSLQGSNVSVFENAGDNYYNVANITVGRLPIDLLDSPPPHDLVYVANQDSESISVINPNTNKLQVGVSFDAEPFHAGHIECNNVKVPTNQYFYIDFPSSCTSKTNEGFQFSTWIEDLGNNSTRIINASTTSYSPIDWLTDALRMGGNDTTATLTPTKFGKFVARFEAVPPAFPSEYLIPLYGIIVSSVVGWSIPGIVSWINAIRKAKMSDEYHKRIQSLYNDGKLDRADVKPLNEIRNKLSDTYAKGKISERQYQNLKGETGVLYEEIHRKRIDFLNGPLKHNSRDDRLLTTIKQEIDEDFAKGKISKEHYDLLNKKIESFVNTEENKKSKLHDADET